MRVLVVSDIEWSDDNSLGNTMSNLFLGNKEISVASLYRRTSNPSNLLCKKYFRISYISILKNFFKKEQIGEYFELEKPLSTKTEVTGEKKAIGLIHKLKLNKLVYFIEDMLFATKKWENKKYKKFLEEFNPDIIFSFAKASKTQLLFEKNILKHLKNCKKATFVVDDIYGANQNKKYKKIIAEQLNLASKVYYITPSLRDEYKEIFGVDGDILTKGCDFSLPVIKKENPIKTIVYAGNLLYGRDNTLINLANAINNHNKGNENKLYLKVYSPTLIDDTVKNALNINGASEFCGAKPFLEIVEILNKADLVLQVESFDKKQQKIVKHSFSTKITDCMQSGSVLFAIGPKEVASMQAANDIDGAFVAFSVEEISDTIKQIAYADLYKNAIKTREYAKEHFGIDKIQEKLVKDFKEIIK